MENAIKHFQTLDEPSLVKMRDASLKFMAELRRVPKTDKVEGRWLSFLGTSGTGKTMLAAIIFDYWQRYKAHYECPQTGATLWRDGLRVDVPEMIRKMKNGDNISAWIQDCCDAPFLFLDEIGAARDKSGFNGDVIFQIITGRIGKPTVITANLDLNAIAEIDARISSRLIRDGNEVVETEAKDFALRPIDQLGGKMRVTP